MIIRWLLYLGCWVAMYYAAWFIFGFMISIECYRRYGIQFNRNALNKAFNKASDNVVEVNWGSNTVIKFVGGILEFIGWPIGYFANIGSIMEDTMVEYERLMNEEEA